MSKRRSRKTKRKNERFLFITGLTAVILVVSTYAWFIGITQVEVSQFEVEVVANKGLTISLDGITFGSSIEVDQAKVTTGLTETYSTHTNSWPTEGMNTYSTVGNMNQTTSRLNIFSKSSITAASGGYKLKASAVDNSTAEEPGYLAFDIFLKNSLCF